MAHKTHAGFTCLVPAEGYDFYCGISGDLAITFIIVRQTEKNKKMSNMGVRCG